MPYNMAVKLVAICEANDALCNFDCCYSQTSSDWFLKNIPRSMLLDSRECMSDQLQHTINIAGDVIDPKTKEITDPDRFISGLIAVGAWKSRLHIMILHAVYDACTSIANEDPKSDKVFLGPQIFCDWLQHYKSNQVFYHISFDYDMYQRVILVMRQILPYSRVIASPKDRRTAKRCARLLLKLRRTAITVEVAGKKKLEDVSQNKNLSSNIRMDVLEWDDVREAIDLSLLQLCLIWFSNLKIAVQIAERLLDTDLFSAAEVFGALWIDKNYDQCRKLLDRLKGHEDEYRFRSWFRGFFHPDFSTKAERWHYWKSIHKKNLWQTFVSMRYKPYSRCFNDLLGYLNDAKTYQLLSNTCSLKQCLWPQCHKKNVKLRKCSRCKSVFYCSRKCQKLDWVFHGCHCKELKERDSLMQILPQRLAYEGEIFTGKTLKF